MNPGRTHSDKWDTLDFRACISLSSLTLRIHLDSVADLDRIWTKVSSLLRDVPQNITQLISHHIIPVIDRTGRRSLPVGTRTVGTRSNVQSTKTNSRSAIERPRPVTSIGEGVLHRIHEIKIGIVALIHVSRIVVLILAPQDNYLIGLSGRTSHVALFCSIIYIYIKH